MLVKVYTAFLLSTIRGEDHYLAPFDPTATPPPTFGIERVVVERLPKVAPGSAIHLSLIEIVRRQYKAHRQAADAADKQAILASQRP